MQEEAAINDDKVFDKLFFILIGDSKEYTRKEIFEVIKLKGGKNGFSVN